MARVASDGDEALSDLFRPIFSALPLRVAGASLLGPFQAPLALLNAFCASAPLARALASHPAWLPASAPRAQRAGRALERTSVLGPFLAVSALPDVYDNGRDGADVAQLFASGRRGDVTAAQATLRGLALQLQEGLHRAVMAMLRHKDSPREATLAFLARLIAANAERGKLQINPEACASHGTFLNLCAVMLRMCAPFLNAVPGDKQFGYISAAYLAAGRVTLPDDETRLAATAAEAAAWGAAASAAGAPAGGWHFVCESFWLTARAMHLGFIKAFSELNATLQEAAQERRTAAELEAQRPAWAGTPQAPAVENRLAEASNNAAALAMEAHQFVACLAEPGLIADALAFYRLVARWLLHTASPGGGAATAPLMPPVPPDFACLPEHIAEDVAEALLGVSRHAPQLLEGSRLDEFMALLVLFTGAPAHVRNPYLRAKCVEVLRLWMPQTQTHPGAPDGASAYTRALFEGHPLATAHLVPHLLALYVDIEFGGGRTVFYDKMNIRFSIGQLLEYLWQVPGHNAAWRSLAAREAGGFYLRFVNMLINDAIYQLDEALKLIPAVRELEAMQADGRLAALPPQERAERTRQGGALQSYLTLAMVHVRMMRFTTAEAACAAPFLLPAMIDRVASMLNYFLAHLAGPERRKLKLSAPEKHGWDPKELLAQLCGIYLHLDAADASRASFAAAVASDARSYSDEAFAEALHVTRALQLLRDDQASALEAFAERARAHAAAGAADEEAFADAPDEFLDPIQCALMLDPVRLPSGHVMDRAVIARHLLSNNNNPFTREPLAAEQLEPMPELAARIAAWRAAKRSGGAAAMDTA